MECLTSRDIVEAFDTDEAWEDRKWVTLETAKRLEAHIDRVYAALEQSRGERLRAEARVARLLALLADLGIEEVAV